MKCRYDFKQQCLKMKIKWVPMHDLIFSFWIRLQFNKHILARSNFLLLQNSPNQNGSSKMSSFIMVYHKYDLYQLYITKFFCFHIPLLSSFFYKPTHQLQEVLLSMENVIHSWFPLLHFYFQSVIYFLIFCFFCVCEILTWTF